MKSSNLGNTRIAEMTKNVNEVKSILVSQPKPQGQKSPYFALSEKYHLKIDFRPFIQVEPVTLKEFRQQKINILDHTAVIFTSRKAVDHFFDICKLYTRLLRLFPEPINFDIISIK